MTEDSVRKHACANAEQRVSPQHQFTQIGSIRSDERHVRPSATIWSTAAKSGEPAHSCPAHGPPTLAIIDLQCSSTRSDVRDQERSRSFGPPLNRLLIAPHVWTNGMARTKKTLIATETMTRRSDGGSSSSSRRAILLIGAGE